MEVKFTFSAWLLAALFGTGLLHAQSTNDAPILRGKYLVENVAMCGDCHTPRDDKGQFDRTQWL